MTGSCSGSTFAGSAPLVSGTSASATATTTHWTWDTPFETPKVTPVFGTLGVKLSTDNYIPWSRVVEAVLSALDLFCYCLGTLPKPSDPRELLYWKQADMAVQVVLLTNMESEIIVQIDSNITAA